MRRIASNKVIIKCFIFSVCPLRKIWLKCTHTLGIFSFWVEEVIDNAWFWQPPWKKLFWHCYDNLLVITLSSAQFLKGFSCQLFKRDSAVNENWDVPIYPERQDVVFLFCASEARLLILYLKVIVRNILTSKFWKIIVNFESKIPLIFNYAIIWFFLTILLGDRIFPLI